VRIALVTLVIVTDEAEDKTDILVQYTELFGDIIQIVTILFTNYTNTVPEHQCWKEISAGMKGNVNRDFFVYVTVRLIS
jgi:hypothetical protein